MLAESVSVRVLTENTDPLDIFLQTRPFSGSLPRRVAKLRGVVCKPQGYGKHARMSNCKLLWLTPSVLSREKKEQFLQANKDLLSQLQGSVMPLEGIAPQVFEAIYQRQQGENTVGHRPVDDCANQQVLDRFWHSTPTLSSPDQLWWSWGRSP